jgi:hypothetical protein
MKGFASVLFLLMLIYGTAMAAVFGTQFRDPNGSTFILDYKTPDCVYRVNIPNPSAPDDPSKAAINTITLSDLSNSALADFINQIQLFIGANPPSFVNRVREFINRVAQSPQEVAEGLEKDCLPALLAEAARRSSPRQAVTGGAGVVYSDWKEVKLDVRSGGVYGLVDDVTVKIGLAANALLVPPEFEVVESTPSGIELYARVLPVGTYIIKVNFAADTPNPLALVNVSGFLNGMPVGKKFELPMNLKLETLSGSQVFARPVPQPYAGPPPLPEEPVKYLPPSISGSSDFDLPTGPRPVTPIHNVEDSRRATEAIDPFEKVQDKLINPPSILDRILSTFGF